MKRNSFIALLCAVFMIAGTTACQEVIEPTPDQTEQEENKDQNDVPTDEEGEEQVNTGVVRSMAFVSASSDETLKQATVQLVSKGVTVSNGTYKGTGIFLNLVIRTETDEEGVISIAEGEYAAADNTAEELTWQVTGTEGEAKTGSYVVAVIKDESTVIDLTEGTVTVSKGKNEEGVEEHTIVVKSGKYDLTYVGTLEGLYTPPVKAAFTGLGGWMDYSGWGMSMVGADLYTEGCTVANQNWQYTYTGNGYHLKLEIYCEGGVIAPGTYEAATELGEFKFNAGNASGGTELFEVVNGAAKSVGKITDGTIVVEQDGDAYKLTINSTVLKATYTGKLEALPEPEQPEQPATPAGEVEFTQLLSCGAQAQYTQAVITLATDGVSSSFDMTTYQTVYTGTGKIFNLTIHAEGFDTETPYIPVGTYNADAESVNPFTWQITGGMPEYNMYWGTMLYDVVDGVATRVDVTEGTVKVTAKGDVYTLVYENGDNKFTYTGQLTGLVAPPQPETPAVEFTQLLSCGTQAQYAQAVITLATDGVSSSFDMTTYQTVYTGTGKIFNLTIHAEGFDTETPYIPVGTYNADAESVNPFTWQITGGMPEYNMYWGTMLYDVVDGTATRIDLTEGTVEVTAVEDVYTLVFETGGEKYTYTGQLTGIVAPLQ